jgi:hypothetical protein
VEEVVNADGCSIAQLCLCEYTWKRHGAYVRCVVRTTGVFRRSELISRAERHDIIRGAASGSCGKRRHRSSADVLWRETASVPGARPWWPASPTASSADGRSRIPLAGFCGFPQNPRHA